MIKTVSIVGTGLIGGSMALAMRDRGLVERIIGVDSLASSAARALELGIVDEVMTIDDAIQASDLIVVAIPVDRIPMEVIKIMNRVDRQVVIDVGSTKLELCEVVAQHIKRGRFVATHPMWGTEKSGPDAAVHGAFEGRVVVLCESQASDPDALELIETLYHNLGMPIKYMGAEEHDLHAAYISHISHITSYALALTVLEKEREDSNIFDLASGGFATTVRLAKSSHSMWTPIILKNKYNILDVLRENIHQLQLIRRMIENDDAEGLNNMIKKANTISKIV